MGAFERFSAIHYVPLRIYRGFKYHRKMEKMGQNQHFLVVSTPIDPNLLF